tara:strand:+ start:11426 stop:11944 length:519 start_codon:yes stop_codon:yes gene_type:complete
MQLNKYVKNSLIAGITFLVLSFYAEHKFYLSVSEVNFNEEKATFEIIGRYFIDDMQEVLQMRYEKTLNLDPEQLSPNIDFYLKRYFSQKFDLRLNGQKVNLNYVGKTFKGDQVVILLQSTAVQDVKGKSLEIENKVLMELFEEQKNLIHLRMSNIKKSAVLISGNSIFKLML